jgi:hypothetical protein
MSLAGSRFSSDSAPGPSPNGTAEGQGVSPTPEEGVQSAPGPEPAIAIAPTQPMKRLNIDVAADLHTRLKLECTKRGLKIADVLRDVLEREFPGAGKT